VENLYHKPVEVQILTHHLWSPPFALPENRVKYGQFLRENLQWEQRKREKDEGKSGEKSGVCDPRSVIERTDGDDTLVFLTHVSTFPDMF